MFSQLLRLKIVKANKPKRLKGHIPFNKTNTKATLLCPSIQVHYLSFLPQNLKLNSTIQIFDVFYLVFPMFKFQMVNNKLNEWVCINVYSWVFSCKHAGKKKINVDFLYPQTKQTVKHQASFVFHTTILIMSCYNVFHNFAV